MRQVINADATKIPLADESVAAIVTSPPYNVGIINKKGLAEYSDDSLDWEDYTDLAWDVAYEMQRVLIPGGRAWVNIMPTAPYSRDDKDRRRFNLAQLWSEALGCLSYQDTVVWIQDSFDGGCAWGSWARPSSPNLRGGHEIILCFYKPYPGAKGGGWARPTPDRWKRWKDDRNAPGGDLVDLYRNVWKMNPARSDYKATFPVELPLRAIRLSTWPDETVLDPFVGTGTTLTACDMLEKHYGVERLAIGTELSPSMTKVAK